MESFEMTLGYFGPKDPDLVAPEPIIPSNKIGRKSLAGLRGVHARDS